jgi:hypothetical protein
MSHLEKISAFVFLSVLWLGSAILRPMPAQSVRSISFREDLSIGVREGDENYMFGNTIYVNADQEGNIYVTDWDRKHVRKFDSHGKYLFTIGKKGQGPGEFSNISVARIDREGNVYVLDVASRKIVYFDRGGTFLNQRLFADRFSDLQFTPGVTCLGIQSKVSEISGIPQIKEIYGIFDGQFKPVVEFFSSTISPPPPPRPDPQAVSESVSKSIFQPEPLYAMGSDGLIYYGFSDKYVIDIYAAEGKKIRTIFRECEAPKIEKKDENDFFENEWDNYVRYIPETIRNQVKRLIRFPENKPFFKRLVPMENGWLLVVVDHERSGLTLFDLFDKDGRFLGRCKAVVPIANLFFKNGKAYAVKDEDGYQFAKRYVYEIR